MDRDAAATQPQHSVHGIGFDPFAFFGVDVNEPASALDMNDIRRKYYQLSLVCHPDKGGRYADMIELHRAYKIVQEGVERMQLSNRFITDLGESSPSDGSVAAVRLPTMHEIRTECDPAFDDSSLAYSATEFPDVSDAAFAAAIARCSCDDEGGGSFLGCTLPDAAAPFVEEEDLGEATIVEYQPLTLRTGLAVIDKSLMPPTDLGLDAPVQSFDFGIAFRAPTVPPMDAYRESRTFESLLNERKAFADSIDVSMGGA